MNTFTQIRGATSILCFHGKKFLIDPFFAAKGTYPAVPSPRNTDKNPLVDLPFSAEQIVKGIDAALITHLHFDHFDEFAAQALPKNLPLFCQSDHDAAELKKFGFSDVTPLRESGTEFAGIMLYKTKALHGDGVTADYYYKKYNLSPEACGIVLQKDGDTFYFAGDTLWFEGVREAIAAYKPQYIALNAANAQTYDGTPILMGCDGVWEVTLFAPEAKIIITHMDAVNHAALSRRELKDFAAQNGFLHRLAVPEDGETLALEF